MKRKSAQWEPAISGTGVTLDYPSVVSSVESWYVLGGTAAVQAHLNTHPLPTYEEYGGKVRLAAASETLTVEMCREFVARMAERIG